MKIFKLAASFDVFNLTFAMQFQNHTGESWWASYDFWFRSAYRSQEKMQTIQYHNMISVYR